MLVSDVIWCTIPSGWASSTALMTPSRSRPSTMTGAAPCCLSWSALAGERVVAVTSWPAAIRPGTRSFPTTPVPPATNTRMMAPSVCVRPLRRGRPAGRDTSCGVLFAGILFAPAQVPGAGDRADVAQLLRVGHRPDGLDLAVEHVQHDDGDQAAVGVPGQDARLPVDPGPVQRRAQLDGPVDLGADQPGHLVTAAHRRDKRRLAQAAAVAVEQHVRGQPLHA